MKKIFSIYHFLSAIDRPFINLKIEKLLNKWKMEPGKWNISNKGFTMIEVLVAMGIVLILSGFVFASILNVRTSSAINTTVDTLSTDLKNQQVKAMSGDTEGRGVPDHYGVFFAPSSYTLFHGLTYSASDSSNLVVPVDASLALSTTFQNSIIRFATRSGEIVGFTQGQNTIVVKETDTIFQKTIELNKYGSIILVN